jgi:hypothetical protein
LVGTLYLTVILLNSKFSTKRSLHSGYCWVPVNLVTTGHRPVFSVSQSLAYFILKWFFQDPNLQSLCKSGIIKSRSMSIPKRPSKTLHNTWFFSVGYSAILGTLSFLICKRDICGNLWEDKCLLDAFSLS